MKSTHLKNKVGGFWLPVFVLFSIALFSGATVQAQYRNDGSYERGQRERYRRGNRGQSQECRRDQRQNQSRRDNRGRRNDRYDDAYYRNGQYGRNDGYGNYGGYSRDAGYGNYGGGGYNNGYRVEQDQGYQAGLNTGTSDAERGQSYNPQRSHYYKDASSQAFRDGFLQGYEQGYRQYGGYNNGRYRRSSNIGNILGGILGRP
jgi:hypothetical protein